MAENTVLTREQIETYFCTIAPHLEIFSDGSSEYLIRLRDMALRSLSPAETGRDGEYRCNICGGIVHGPYEKPSIGKFGPGRPSKGKKRTTQDRDDEKVAASETQVVATPSLPSGEGGEARFVAPCPLPSELAEVLVEYDLITAKADRGDPEWDFVMRAADYRVIRDFFASLKREGTPIKITNQARPA